MFMIIFKYITRIVIISTSTIISGIILMLTLATLPSITLESQVFQVFTAGRVVLISFVVGVLVASIMLMIDCFEIHTVD